MTATVGLPVLSAAVRWFPVGIFAFPFVFPLVFKHQNKTENREQAAWFSLFVRPLNQNFIFRVTTQKPVIEVKRNW